MTAVELRRMIGRKDISPVELLDSCIARIEATDGALNAVVTRSLITLVTRQLTLKKPF